MARAPVFEIDEISPGMFALTSSDFAPYTAMFESVDWNGGGYDWERIAIHLLENSDPSLKSEVTFDSEASMFCACANSREPLIRLMDLMRDTLRSKKRLAVAIAQSQPIDEDAPDSSAFPFIVLVYFDGYVPEVETIYEAVSQMDGPDQQVDEACCGAGESVVLVRTHNVDQTMECCLAALREAKQLKFALIGSKAAQDAAYCVLWPKREGQIRPKYDPR